jgi:hypothetical protein
LVEYFPEYPFCFVLLSSNNNAYGKEKIQMASELFAFQQETLRINLYRRLRRRIP